MRTLHPLSPCGDAYTSAAVLGTNAAAARWQISQRGDASSRLCDGCRDEANGPSEGDKASGGRKPFPLASVIHVKGC